MNRILKFAIYILATVYFLVDAVFMTITKPTADWFGRRFLFDRLRLWIKSLRPYPALALFAVPVIVLEPVKPVAAYLAATSHIGTGIVVLIIGEVLKLVIVERLFCLTRDKLILIPAFSWAYCKFRRANEWLETSEAWQSVRRLSKIATCAVRSYAAGLKSSYASPNFLAVSMGRCQNASMLVSRRLIAQQRLSQGNQLAVPLVIKSEPGGIRSLTFVGSASLRG